MPYTINSKPEPQNPKPYTRKVNPPLSELDSFVKLDETIWYAMVKLQRRF
jgi:hypothetical protein